MKLVIALLFFGPFGEIEKDKTLYFDKFEIDKCRFYCQEYSRHQSYFESKDCICKLAVVNSSVEIVE
jgi:hypothetical protein|tara:strand:- start:349 stop:549 length:201 start_codon:yes stop_codon:yes gene_type:complete